MFCSPSFTFADFEDQVPAAAPRREDSEGVQDDVQGKLREDILRMRRRNTIFSTAQIKLAVDTKI